MAIFAFHSQNRAPIILIKLRSQFRRFELRTSNSKTTRRYYFNYTLRRSKEAGVAGWRETIDFDLSTFVFEKIDNRVAQSIDNERTDSHARVTISIAKS